MSEIETRSRPAAPDLVVAHPGWRTALDQVRAALSRPRAVVAVLGPPGTGKTLLLRTLLAELRAEGREAVLLARGDGDPDPVWRSGSAAAPGIVLVDEADRIDPATLQALADTGARGIVLAALPSSSERLGASPGMLVVPLRAMRPDEATAFIRARLAAAGAADRLTGDALDELVANGAGIPRLLCGLLIAAEFVASLQGAPTVTADHVREAVLLRGDFISGAAAQDSSEPDSPPQSSVEALTEEAEDGVRCPDPAERWPESAGPTASPPVRKRAKLWAALACAAVLALVAAYAARQPVGARLGRQIAAMLPGRPSFAPTDAVPAPSIAPALPVAAEVASGQAGSLVPTTAGAGPIPSASGLPRGVLPHVVLSYHQGDEQAARRAAEVARALRSAGIAANDQVPVLARIAEPGITYFFAEDREGADDVSRALGGAFGETRIVTLRQDEPLPRPGTIELQVAPDQAEAESRTR